MASRTQVVLIDDLDGKELDKGRTMDFALSGVTYEIDLSEKNAKKLEDALAPFIEAARRTGGRRKAGTQAASTSGKEDLAAIRQWARDNGHEVSERGRISAAVREAYEAAH